jgi:hypothetical protein
MYERILGASDTHLPKIPVALALCSTDTTGLLLCCSRSYSMQVMNCICVQSHYIIAALYFGQSTPYPKMFKSDLHISRVNIITSEIRKRKPCSFCGIASVSLCTHLLPSWRHFKYQSLSGMYVNLLSSWIKTVSSKDYGGEGCGLMLPLNADPSLLVYIISSPTLVIYVFSNRSAAQFRWHVCGLNYKWEEVMATHVDLIRSQCFSCVFNSSSTAAGRCSQLAIHKRCADQEAPFVGRWSELCVTTLSFS